LAPGETPPDGRGAWLRIGREMPADPREYAAVLYDTLHRLDTQHLDWIAVEAPARHSRVGRRARPPATKGDGLSHLER
jgi:hypothetical protein